MEEEHKLTWFKNAKYGLFIHFGLYSLLAGKWQEQETVGWRNGSRTIWIYHPTIMLN